ncbi:hypothetical protein M1446_01230 [Candidatus Dependentiae bacterium]|nr:hypothetical protein [Candidatus Dependentiae bacterium]
MKRHIFALTLLISTSLVAMDSGNDKIMDSIDATISSYESNDNSYVSGSVDYSSYTSPSDDAMMSSIDTTIDNYTSDQNK